MKSLVIHKKEKGFTLIELMVAVTIFAIVMLVSMGAILTIVDGNRKNQTMQVAINNLNFAVESMTRSIKTGYNYAVGPSCESITLNTSDDLGGSSGDDQVTYSLVQHSDSDNFGLYYDNDDTGYGGFITAPDLNITKLCFEQTGVGSQPALTIVIQGKAMGAKESVQTEFNLYTSVTQRQVQYD